MAIEENNNERMSKAINGLSTGIVFLLLVIGGLTIYLVFFTQPIPKEPFTFNDGVVYPDSTQTTTDSIIDTTAAK